MPGTVGTAVAALLAWLVRTTIPQTATLTGSIFLAIGITIFAIFVTNAAIKTIFKDNPSDPQEIVIDEFAGLFVTLIALPNSLLSYVAAFIMFRFFDILKPYPIRQVEQLPGAYGIVLDDVVAGAISSLLLNFFLF